MAGLTPRRSSRRARAWALLLLAVPVAGAVHAEDIGLHAVRIPNDPGYWRRAGFVDMVGPTWLPINKSVGEDIAVWVRVPAKGTIKVRWLPDQKRYTLAFPPGTIADRVDSSKDEHDAMQVIHGVADVRGARIGTDGRIWFHVYEPVPGEPKKWLKGYEWLHRGPAANARAADSLVKLFYPGAPNKAEQEIAEFRQLNQCGACHQVNRPTPARVAAATTTDASSPTGPMAGSLLPMTDDDAFLQPITVMTDSMVIRNDRPWDLNADDPFVTVHCGRQPTKPVTHGDKRYYQCADRGVPIGTLDMRAALKQGDPHARKVCAARRYLYEHMDAAGRKAFKVFYAECR